MLWLYLLAAVTLLTIALRRVVRRQTPLSDELYAKNVAIDHIQSGVAWVRADGRVGSVNHSLADTFKTVPRHLTGQDWSKMFPPEEHSRLQAEYSQMLLKGIATFHAPGVRSDGSQAWLNVRLVAVHDHTMRFVGHHCMIEDRTQEHQLEEQVRQLVERALPATRIQASLANAKKVAIPESARSESPAGVAR
jgi:PAS domain S-box-containing protein